VLVVALAVEFADELVDGVKGAALPAIQHSLGLSYTQLGLLASVPLLLGGLLELPLGLLAGQGRRRRVAVLGGGVVFVLSIAAVAFARDFAELLTAFVIFYPASGAFVSLTQATLMDAEPDRQARSMARWDLAGNAGAVAGPVLLVAVLAAHGDWRGGYLLVAALSAAAWLSVLGTRPARDASARDASARDASARDAPARDSPGSEETGGEETGGEETADEPPAGLRDILGHARVAARWLVLLEAANLLVDGLTGFVAVYLVDVAHLTPALAAIAIAFRLGAALAGDAALVIVLERFQERAKEGAILRITAVAAAVLFPAFLLVPGAVPKLVSLAMLSAVTASWYPLLQARLYGTVPSPVAVTLSTAASLAGGLGPLAVGLAAQAFGLPWALAGLGAVPLIVAFGAHRFHQHGQLPTDPVARRSDFVHSAVEHIRIFWT
jgi:FSR family fosmidomycin resistance protein-like MFS transporter